MSFLEQAIEHAAGNSAKNEAIRFNGDCRSYGELFARAAQLSHGLLGLSFRPGDRAGLFLDKSLEAVEAILGIMLAGGCYVPFDCAGPGSRLADMMRRSELKFIVVSVATLDKLLKVAEEAGFSGHVLVADGDSDKHKPVPGIAILSSSWLQDRPTKRGRPIAIANDSPAAILFTSGSTGSPKGVVLTHGNIDAFVDWVRDRFQLTADDRVAGSAPLFFDLSLLDLFAPLASGAAIILLPQNQSANAAYLLNTIASEKLTIFQTVPSVLKLLSYADSLPDHKSDTLRGVLFAGEKMPVRYLKQLMTRFRSARFFNIYGCTETNDTFCYEVPEDAAELPDELPIGRELPYVDYLIVDDNGDPADKGELCVACPTIMTGYLGETEAEAGRHFLDDERTYYRTRDIVRRLSDGNLHLCGRTDNIVKSSGYRVNLLEIEDRLLACPGVRDAAVVALDHDLMGTRIAAYVVQNDAQPTLSSLALRGFCADEMPAYMVPHVVEVCKGGLKLTASGKIDKRDVVRKIQKEWDSI